MEKNEDKEEVRLTNGRKRRRMKYILKGRREINGSTKCKDMEYNTSNAMMVYIRDYPVYSELLFITSIAVK